MISVRDPPFRRVEERGVGREGGKLISAFGNGVPFLFPHISSAATEVSQQRVVTLVMDFFCVESEDSYEIQQDPDNYGCSDADGNVEDRNICCR